MDYDKDSRFCMNCPKTFDGNIPYFRLFLPFWGDIWAWLLGVIRWVILTILEGKRGLILEVKLGMKMGIFGVDIGILMCFS